ncbi:Conserved oligomeric Golgi complex subunit 1 [Aphelenchoides bicaudatus]|nr:Conserved oligomeric Golgi complex subunit 1 [Aphelenchoides bicaudatus]
MNIERLMQDLTLDQLDEIQRSLNHEVEKKKEDLRQMVGRRYRDVLLAANAVKRLTDISADILQQVQTMKTSTISVIELQHLKSNLTPLNKKLTAQYFILLNSLIPLIGAHNDGLSDVFCLLLAENLHRSITLDKNATDASKLKVMNSFGEQLINYRMRLNDLLMDKLGELSDWSSVSGQLMAIAYLKHKTVEELLHTYLEARQQNVFSNIRTMTSIDVIRKMRETMSCVEQVFGQGQGLNSAYQAISTPGWCPEVLAQHINDQPFVYAKLFNNELSKINQAYRSNFTQLKVEEVEVLSSEWMIQLCQTAKESIREMCERFDNSAVSTSSRHSAEQFGRATEQLVEFAEAIDRVFKTDCSSVVSNQTVYRNLFGTSMLDRWQKLIHDEILHLEKDLRAQLAIINCNPPPLFHKRATKFDGLLAAGVSHELHALTHKFFNHLSALMQRVEKYVQIGYDENVELLRTHLSDAVLELLQRLVEPTVKNKIVTDNEQHALLPSEENQRWLKNFRLYLALVQHEPSVISHCMFDNVEKAVQANQMLREAAENALSHLMDYIIDEAIQDSELHKLSIMCSSTAKCLNFVQVPGKIVLNSETGSSTSAPTQLSKQLFDFLYQICRRVSQNSFSHLFTRNVNVHVSDRLASILSTTIDKCANELPSGSAFAVQLILDARILHQMFPHRGFVEAIELLQSKMDPFEWSILDKQITQNARNVVKRCTMLFGQLQVDSNALFKDDADKGQPELVIKDINDQPLIDILPKLENINRLSTIPRLTKIKEADKNQRGGSQPKDGKKVDPKNLNFSVDGFINYFMQGKSGANQNQ